MRKERKKEENTGKRRQAKLKTNISVLRLCLGLNYSY